MSYYEAEFVRFDFLEVQHLITTAKLWSAPISRLLRRGVYAGNAPSALAKGGAEGARGGQPAIPQGRKRISETWMDAELANTEVIINFNGYS